jgi:hypothetical protein
MTPSSRRFFLCSLAAAGIAFAHELRSQSAKRAVRLQVSSFTDKTDTLVWTAYAVALAAWTSENADNSQIPEGVYRPSFPAELAARQRQLLIWQELTEKQPMTNAYIDAVASASSAGFLREYVWHFHRSAEWGEPAAELQLAEFAKWRAVHLQGHEPKTGAVLYFGPRVAQ